MKRIFYTLAALISFIVISNTAAFAQPQQERVPGGIAIIPIAKRIQQEPTVFYNKKRVTLIPDSDNKNQWLALIGLSLKNKKLKHTLNINWSDSVKSQQTFNSHKKEYAESHITIKDKKKVEPGEEELKRIWREQKIINRAKASRLDNIPQLAMALPVKGRISSSFGLKRFFNGKPKNPHGGLDIAAPSGTEILAPTSGTVVATGNFFFSGNCVYIDHGRGLISFYGHMSKINVKKGDHVKQGDLLGKVGATGRVTGPHLHWSVGLNGTWVNPNLFMSPVKKSNPPSKPVSND